LSHSITSAKLKFCLFVRHLYCANPWFSVWISFRFDSNFRFRYTERKLHVHSSSRRNPLSFVASVVDFPVGRPGGVYIMYSSSSLNEWSLHTRVLLK